MTARAVGVAHAKQPGLVKINRPRPRSEGLEFCPEIESGKSVKKTEALARPQFFFDQAGLVKKN